MDWFQFPQNFFQTMMESQQAMWNTIMAANQRMTETVTPDSWEQIITQWERAFNTSLDTHSTLFQMWVKLQTTRLDTDTAAKLTHTLTLLNTSWVKAQKTMWGQWFIFLKQLDMPLKTGSAPTNIENMAEAWQKNLQEMTTAQNQWFQKWVAAFTSKQ
jgi:hypothetical protein